MTALIIFTVWQEQDSAYFIAKYVQTEVGVCSGLI